MTNKIKYAHVGQVISFEEQNIKIEVIEILSNSNNALTYLSDEDSLAFTNDGGYTDEEIENEEIDWVVVELSHIIPDEVDLNWSMRNIIPVGNFNLLIAEFNDVIKEMTIEPMVKKTAKKTVSKAKPKTTKSKAKPKKVVKKTVKKVNEEVAVEDIIKE